MSLDYILYVYVNLCFKGWHTTKHLYRVSVLCAKDAHIFQSTNLVHESNCSFSLMPWTLAAVIFYQSDLYIYFDAIQRPQNYCVFKICSLLTYTYGQISGVRPIPTLKCLKNIPYSIIFMNIYIISKNVKKNLMWPNSISRVWIGFCKPWFNE